MSRPLLSVPSGCAASGGGKKAGASLTQTGGRFRGDEATRASLISQNRGPMTPSKHYKHHQQETADEFRI